MDPESIAIASDHAGYDLKEVVKRLLNELNYNILDFGPLECSSVDYPDFGERVSEAVSLKRVKRGILICGTGLGMSIVANKFPGVRATLCHDEYTARMSRLHNDSNILVLGGRVLNTQKACSIVKVWLSTEFEGGRHLRRIEKIRMIEERIQNGR